MLLLSICRGSGLPSLAYYLLFTTSKYFKHIYTAVPVSKKIDHAFLFGLMSTVKFLIYGFPVLRAVVIYRALFGIGVGG